MHHLVAIDFLDFGYSSEQIEHLNRIKTGNRIVNLRLKSVKPHD